MPAAPPRPWSPYGLEAYRVQLLRRRSRWLLALFLAGALVLGAVLAMSLREGTDINISGSGGNQVDVPIPADKPRPKPTTLKIAPGRTTVLDKPIQPEARNVPTPSAQPAERGPGLNWLGLLQTVGPTLAAGAYAWRLGRKRMMGGLEQVNLGVYKGAMPLELVTAQHRRHVFTSRMAHASLFGKGPLDHAPVPILVRAAPAARARFERVR